MGVGRWFGAKMEKTRQLNQASDFLCPRFLLSIIQNIFNFKCLQTLHKKDYTPMNQQRNKAFSWGWVLGLLVTKRHTEKTMVTWRNTNQNSESIENFKALTIHLSDQAIMRWSLATALGLGLISLVSGQSSRRGSRQDEEAECPQDFVSFEVVTGYVYTAPADMLDSQPGTLMLTDCIDTCRGNSSCKSINYETGLCVLFSSSADEEGGQLTPSQFPVFTIYVQKNCLPSAASCDAAWSFDRVMNHQLDTEVRRLDESETVKSNPPLPPQIRKRGQVNSRQECMEQCLAEVDFECRLVNFISHFLVIFPHLEDFIG